MLFNSINNLNKNDMYMKHLNINHTPKGCFNIDHYVKMIIKETKPKSNIMKQYSESKLAIMFKASLDKQYYEKCAEIKAEIDSRISSETIDREMVDEIDFTGLNGLFDNYKPLVK